MKVLKSLGCLREGYRTFQRNLGSALGYYMGNFGRNVQTGAENFANNVSRYASNFRKNSEYYITTLKEGWPQLKAETKAMIQDYKEEAIKRLKASGKDALGALTYLAGTPGRMKKSASSLAGRMANSAIQGYKEGMETGGRIGGGFHRTIHKISSGFATGALFPFFAYGSVVLGQETMAELRNYIKTTTEDPAIAAGFYTGLAAPLVLAVMSKNSAVIGLASAYVLSNAPTGYLLHRKPAVDPARA